MRALREPSRSTGLRVVGVRVAGLLVGAIGLCVAVSVIGPFDQFIFGEIAAIAIVVMGLNVLMGVAGLFSVASAAIVGLGATASFFFIVVSGVPFLVAVLLTLIAAWVLGLLLGLVTLRISGIYLAIVTFGMVEASSAILESPTAFSGTGFGLEAPAVGLPGGGSVTGAEFAVAACAIAVVVGVVTTRMVRSRSGRAWRALKVEPAAAELAGVHVAWYRANAFAYSTLLACLGGILQAFLVSATSPSDYGATLAIQHLSYLVTGGMGGGVLGPAAGVLLLFGVPNLFARGLGIYGGIFYGSLMLLALTAAPGGVAAAVRFVGVKTWETVRRVRLGSAR